MENKVDPENHLFLPASRSAALLPSALSSQLQPKIMELTNPTQLGQIKLFFCCMCENCSSTAKGCPCLSHCLTCENIMVGNWGQWTLLNGAFNFLFSNNICDDEKKIDPENHLTDPAAA